MNSENRQNVRYEDIGRVDAAEICTLPGVLNDISLTGCKVHFPIPVTIDMEGDFELKIKPAQKSSEDPFVLVCHPQWVKDNNGETEIGFSILRSPDTPLLANYIEELKKNSDDPASVKDMIIDSKATFI
ncbi:MAG: PilZ domain-containing protein [Treponema sp.]